MSTTIETVHEALGIVNANCIFALSTSQIMQLAGSCRANYTFIQTYHSYLNPLHNRGNTGQCCDSQAMPPCPERSFCDNIFTICVQEPTQSLPQPENIRQEDCPLGYGVSQTFDNRDNITFNTSSPVTFTGDIWPVRYTKTFPYIVGVE